MEHSAWGMPAYLINLDRCPERLNHARRQLLRAGLGAEVERLSGVDGRGGLPERLRAQFPASRLTSAEVGCYASHLLTAEAIRAMGAPCGLVLEDDVVLFEGFARVAQRAAETATGDWDVIHLCTTYKRNKTRTLAALDTSHDLVAYTRLPVSSTVYIISARGCDKLLSPRPRTRPIDQEFRQRWATGLNTIGVRPAVSAAHAAIPSLIGDRSGGKRYWGPRSMADAAQWLRATVSA